VRIERRHWRSSNAAGATGDQPAPEAISAIRARHKIAPASG
jgi:hypothetical protein